MRDPTKSLGIISRAIKVAAFLAAFFVSGCSLFGGESVVVDTDDPDRHLTAVAQDIITQGCLVFVLGSGLTEDVKLFLTPDEIATVDRVQSLIGSLCTVIDMTRPQRFEVYRQVVANWGLVNKVRKLRGLPEVEQPPAAPG